MHMLAWAFALKHLKPSGCLNAALSPAFKPLRLEQSRLTFPIPQGGFQPIELSSHRPTLELTCRPPKDLGAGELHLGQLAPGMYNDRLFSLLRATLTSPSEAEAGQALQDLEVRPPSDKDAHTVYVACLRRRLALHMHCCAPH
jgi:hypothetical protein